MNPPHAFLAIAWDEGPLHGSLELASSPGAYAAFKRRLAKPEFHSFLLGFLGNQPLRTLSRCSKTSNMDQKHENDKTPRTVEAT